MNDRDDVILEQLDAELEPASDTRHHVLRRHGNVLLDAPLPPCTWAATLWIDRDGTWQRALWIARRRGFEPTVVRYGDVIEFGTYTATGPVVWYGHLTDVTDDAVICTGPYPALDDAWRAAQHALDRWTALQHSELRCRSAKTLG